MSESKHQLKVIMFTDIVGYTALMGEDEKLALSILNENREIHKKWFSRFKGSWLKEMGDGILSSFDSIVDAVYCAGAILEDCKEIDHLKLRIGIHLGDVVMEGKEIYGDGINIASRIQSFAGVDQIVISETVHSNIKNKQGIRSSFLGEKTLKNVADPVSLYEIEFSQDISFQEFIPHKKSKSKNIIRWVIGFVILAVTFLIYRSSMNDPRIGSQNNSDPVTVKSIAVLPFENLTNDPSQDFLIAGMQDNLITVLSQIKSLDVISRTSTLAYQNKGNKTIPQIAEELNVDALIETSVLRTGDSVRINVQFVKAFPHEDHLWANIFDRSFHNILFLFDDVAQAVATGINKTLEVNKSVSPSEVNPEAYKAYMNGKFLAEFVPIKENVELALGYFEQSIALDSTFAPAYAGISWVWITRFQSQNASAAEAIPKIYSYYQKAVDLDPDFPNAQYQKAIISFQCEWDWEKSEKAFQKAIELNPNHSFAHAHYSHLLMYQQRFEEAIPHMELAMKLDPFNPHIWGLCAVVYWHMGNFEKALEITGKNPNTMGKPIVDESIAYLNGNLNASMDILEERFGADSIMFKEVRKAFIENGYKAAMKKLATGLEINYPNAAAVGLAVFYNRAGMTDDAIRVLEKGYEIHDPNMPYAFVGFELKNLESDVRYKKIAENMDLPY